MNALGWLLLLALTACMPSRRDIRQAQELVASRQPTAINCAASDHCAQPSPLLDRVDALLATGKQRHFVSLLEYGQDALLARVHLIRAARQRIDLQSYIFVEDDSGILLVSELIAAARRGVKVRVLVDQLFSADDPIRLAELSLVHRNLEIQLYNPNCSLLPASSAASPASISACTTSCC